jgi:histidyl-tRNA synthetase
VNYEDSVSKGTRDFYPPLMAVRNFIMDGWKAASRRNGFEEYDGPIFEYLQMYQVKSGDEIVEQLFHLTDRGGRELAIRPEITPTLARMVNEQINALPRPVKWFSMPRLCRASARKRAVSAFFQWNLDIIGINDCRADASDLRHDRLSRCRPRKPADIAARSPAARMLAALLLALGVQPDKLTALYAILDKKAKIPAEAFAELLAAQVTDPAVLQKIQALMSVDSLDSIGTIVPMTPEAQSALDELKSLFALLAAMGVGDYCRFDIAIVRGLAYYTGMVFEIHDLCGDLRAVCGGGRYDNHLRDFGGPAVSPSA